MVTGYWLVRLGSIRNRADNWADNWVDNQVDNRADNQTDNQADNQVDIRADVNEKKLCLFKRMKELPLF